MRGEFIFKSCLFGLMVLGSRRLKIMGLASWPLVAMCFFQLGNRAGTNQDLQTEHKVEFALLNHSRLTAAHLVPRKQELSPKRKH